MKNKKDFSILKWMSGNFSEGNFFWLFIFVVIPFVDYKPALDSDTTPKYICFALVTIIFSLFPILKKNKKADYDKGIFRQPFLLFAGIYFLFSINSFSSGINKTESIYELIQVLFPFIFLLIVTYMLLHDKNSIITLLKFQNFAVIIFFSFASIQLYSAWRNSLTSHIPLNIDFSICSTLGNKNFLSETLLLFFPLSISAAIILKSFWKIFSILSCLVILCLLIILKTSSAQLAFVFAGIFCASVLFIFGKNIFNAREFQKIRKTIGYTMLLLASVVIVIFFSTHVFDPLKSKFKNIYNITSVKPDEQISSKDFRNTNSVYERLMLWDKTYHLFKEKPFTGIGAANWKIFYPKYGISGAYYLNTGVMHYEHPHNEYLFMMAERGIIVLISWIAILLCMVYYSVKMIRMTTISLNEKIILLAIIFGVSSFLFISFFGYPLHRVYSSMLLMILFSIVLSLYHHHNRFQKTSSAYLLKMVFVCCFISGIYVCYVMWNRLSGEVNMKKAFTEQGKGYFERMKIMLNKADNDYFKLDLTSTPLNWYRGLASNYLQQYDSALHYFLLAEKENPYHIQVLSDIGASLENAGRHDESLAYIKRALAITPLYPEALLNLSIVYYNKGEIDSAYSIIHSFVMPNYNLTYEKCVETVLTTKATNLLSKIDDQKKHDALLKKINDKIWLKQAHNNCKKKNITFENELLEEISVR